MKLSLLTFIKKYFCLKTLLSKRSLYQNPLSILWVFVFIASLNTLLIYKLYQKKQDLELANRLIDKLEVRVCKGALNKQKEVDYFGSLEVFSNSSIAKPTLKGERLVLDVLKGDKSLKGSDFVADLQNRQTANEPNLFLIEEKQGSKITQKLIGMKSSLSMDNDDLKNFLSSVEQNISPKRLFKEFHLSKQSYSASYEVFEVNAKILERKKRSYK